jgi:peptidoglycan/xylan/chitin deacetylase (PgdA/CDA1 family)
MKRLRPLIIAIFLILAALVATWRLAKNPRYQLFGELLYRVETTDKVIALTFDDGPSPQNTEELLELLKEKNVPATFFMIGKNLDQYPEIAKKVFLAGHQIGNHTYSHERALFSGPDYFRDEIKKTDILIRNLGYNDEIVFRPPFGKKLISLPWVLKDLKKLTVTWDVESEDTETQDVEILKKHVLGKVRPGSIILFHDGFSRKDGTLAAVRSLIDDLRAQGYQFVTVNDLRSILNRPK